MSTAKSINIKILAVDYRLPPLEENPGAAADLADWYPSYDGDAI